MEKVIAGADVRAQVLADYAAGRELSQLHGMSADTGLVSAQRIHAAQGIKGVGVYRTFKGFSVRYLSGLDNFGIVEPSTTLEAALAAAVEWVARDPQRRYALDCSA